LSLFLKRSLEHQLASVLPELSGSKAIAAMRSIGLGRVGFERPDDSAGFRRQP